MPRARAEKNMPTYVVGNEEKPLKNPLIRKLGIHFTHPSENNIGIIVHPVSHRSNSSEIYKYTFKNPYQLELMTYTHVEIKEHQASYKGAAYISKTSVWEK